MVSSNKNHDDSLDGTAHVLPGTNCASNSSQILVILVQLMIVIIFSILYQPILMIFCQRLMVVLRFFLMVVTAHLNGASDGELL